MRRRAPRSIALALERVAAGAAPLTTLARVQSCWPEVAGAVVAAEAEPVSEREGVVTVACRSSVWAQELDLLSADLVARLNEVLAEPGEPPLVRSLRLRTAGPAAFP